MKRLLKFNESDLSIQDRVLNIVKKFNKDATINVPLHDLDISFLDIVEISFILEAEFDIEISDKLVDSLKSKESTTSDIIKMIMDLK